MNVGPNLEHRLQETVETCNVLSAEQARDFIENGFVLIKNAFSPSIADRVCRKAWSELRSEHGIEASNPSTWRSHPHGYIRTSGQDLRVRLAHEAETALMAQADIVGGRHRLPLEGEWIEFTGGVIGNFGVETDPPWRSPMPRQHGWHKDGWHFRHFLDSPEKGLLTVPIYTEILPQSGGTFLAVDSIAPVAKLLSQHPSGFHADSVQGSGYLIPYLIDQCSNFVELTGEPGDLAILHPFMLHRRTVNPTDRPRFIANMAIELTEPMRFNREPDDPFSLVELAVLHALEESDFPFTATNSRESFVPFPFRKGNDAKLRQEQLVEEMRTMARSGVVTPPWAQDFGYMTNNLAN